MKLEEQRLIRIDGGNVMQVWKDLETGEDLFEGSGQVPIQIHSPQGVQTISVSFQFTVEADSLEDAAAKFGAELQAAGQRTAKEAVEKINATGRKIQVPGNDQIIPFGKDRMRRNGQ
jgi:hypothetical protein